MKFIREDTQVILREIPDEISLSINISNCPHRCEGCHSPYLREDIGERVDISVIREMVTRNKGISCICFFGGDGNRGEMIDLVLDIKTEFPWLKVAVYSGDTEIDNNLAAVLDYYKVGPYIGSNGPLDSKTTNQRLYRVRHKEDSFSLEDITYLFWNKEN